MRFLFFIVTLSLLTCLPAFSLAEEINLIDAVLSPVEIFLPDTATGGAATRPDLTEAQLAFDTFTALFVDEANPLPRNVRVIGTRFRDGLLTVNVSGDILLWGGNENERVLIAMLKEAARTVPGATSLTLLIEDEARALAEGRLVKDVALYEFKQSPSQIIPLP